MIISGCFLTAACRSFSMMPGGSALSWSCPPGMDEKGTMLEHLGPEPLCPDFTAGYMQKVAAGKDKPLKNCPDGQQGRGRHRQHLCL